MNRYFISYLPEYNDNKLENGIYSFKYDVLQNEKSLRKAEKEISKEDFGDDRNITIINIIKL